MQTLLTQIGYAKTARTLQDRELSSQRGHAWNILLALGSGEFKDSFAVQMWRGYERSLCIYGLTMCLEWRVGRNHPLDKMGGCFSDLDDDLKAQGRTAEKPPWLGAHEADILRSNRSNLVRLHPEYGAVGWKDCPERMPMIWPQLTDADPRGYRLRVSSADTHRLENGERKLPDWLIYDAVKREITHV